MGRSLQAETNNRLTFENQILLWMELTRQLDQPAPPGADGHAHDRAMDEIYERREPVERWLCDQTPANAMEALCLLEIVRLHDDEAEARYLRALSAVQSWLALLLAEEPAVGDLAIGRLLLARVDGGVRLAPAH
jgi:hypothetical protein